MLFYGRAQLIHQLQHASQGACMLNVLYTSRYMNLSGVSPGNGVPPNAATMHNLIRPLISLYHKCSRSSARRCDGHLSCQSMPSSARTATRRDRIGTQHLAKKQQRTFSSSSNSASSSLRSSSAERSDGGPAYEESAALDFDALSKCIPSQDPNSVTSAWYVVATAALLAFHKETAVGALWKYINDCSGLDGPERVSIARRIREACLKSSVLVGFPRGINGLSALQTSVERNSPGISPILKSDQSLRAGISSDERLRRGKEFFSQIYSNHTDRVLQAMSASSGGDLSYYAIASVYGDLMAEMSILNPAETVMLEFVCCLADDVAPQAKGHFFGCKNLGVPGREIKGAVSLVRKIAQYYGLACPGSSRDFHYLAKAESW